ncbi:MAG: ABC transporter substrate-binding protein [Desulfobacterales bacterium]|nr:ABC transporter substrate-binding protein [Desulfobacterales bacterium]
MRKRFNVLFLAIVSVIVFLPYLAHAQATKEAADMKPLKVGVISAQSGPIAFMGTSVLRGVETAIKNINEKGTLGKGPGILVGNQRYKLEIANYDDSGDPAKSVAGMRRLSEMYKLPVVLGPFGTPQVWACQEVNVGLGILFNGLSTSDQSRKKGNPLYIQERIPGLYYGDPMAQVCIDKGFKRACVITDINEAFLSWGKRFKEKFEALGGQVPAFESVDIKNTTDFHSVMTSFRAKNPDIIFISCYEEPGALITNHAIDVGYKGKFMYTSEWGAKSEKIVGLDKVQGSLVQAMNYTYYRKYPDRDKRGVFTAFHKQYMDTYKEEYAQPATSIYDPALMFARAMEIAGSVTDARAIRAACPKALQDAKLPMIYPNIDVLKNGLMWGAPELMLEVKENGYTLLKELKVAKELLE